MKRVVVLGSTGSVGRQALDLAREHPDALRIAGLSAHRRLDDLERQLEAFEPEAFALADAVSGRAWLEAHPAWASRCVGVGPEALERLAALEADIVLNALLGAAGLRPTLAALAAGHDVALANKESLVVGGELVCRAAARHRARLVPVDSEHSAIAQCLRSGQPHEVRRLILTASGGPFRQASREALQAVDRRQALAHPTWSMGPKISVDSATLMNKGLEILEAHWLFDVPIDAIDVVVHPQSIIHSMVEFVDGSIVAQAGPPDMRLPIWHALHEPQRVDLGREPFDWTQQGPLTFEPLDAERFPCVDLAREAGRRGGVYPAVLNAANEVAVAAFLDQRLAFVEIPVLLHAALEAVGGAIDAPRGDLDLDGILHADRQARDVAARWVAARSTVEARR